MTLTSHTTLHGLPVVVAALADGQEASEIEIIPTGAFELNDGRGAFRLDDPAGFVLRSMAHAMAHSGGEILIDFDHSSERTDGARRTDAAGWITDMRHDDATGRIIASVRWTAQGRQALADRAYRFISPVFAHDKGDAVLGIVRAGLTNTPAISGMKAVAASTQQKEAHMSKLTDIAKALGLGEDADEAAIVAAASQAAALVDTAKAVLDAAEVEGDLDDAAVTTLAGKLQAAAAGAGDPDPAKYVPKAMFDELSTTVAAMRSDGAKAKAEGLVAAARKAGKLPPNEPALAWANDYAAKDPAGFEAWVSAAPVVCASGELIPALKPTEVGALTVAEKEVCATMGVTEAQFIATRDGKPLAKKEA